MQADYNRSSNRLSGLISILGLVAMLLGLIIAVLLPTIRLAGWMILVLGVLLLGIAFIIDFRRVTSAVTGKRGLFSTGTTVMASIFIGITLLVNTISINNYARFDTTVLSQFTLTSQTQDVLEQLDKPVQVLVFTVPGDLLGDTILNFISEYQNFTDHISLSTIDPDEHPDQARQYGITQYSTVIFESGDNIRAVSPQEIFIQVGEQLSAEMEHPFTSAILEVSGIIQKKVYFLTGHRESGITTDYNSARQSLLDNLYKVDTLDLQLTPVIPEDATALIIAGPQRSLSSSEMEILEEYLENNGWLMLLLNPNPPMEYKELVSSWGINIEEGVVIDPSSYVSPNIASPLIPGTRNLFGLPETYFPGATAITQQEEFPELIIREPLFYTSQDSWLDKDYDHQSEPEFVEGVDERHSLVIGVLIAGTFGEGNDVELAESTEITRIVIVGDSDFAANQHFYNGDNGALFVNLVELLTAGKELITIERKVLPFRRMLISQEEANFIQISSIALLPLLVLIAGGVIWWRRR